MRRVLTCCVLALVAAGCRDAVIGQPLGAAPEVLITESPSPYREVTAGSVTAVLPDAWHPEFAGTLDDPRQGLVAGPGRDTWRGERPPAEGYAAMWIDGTRVGVPSDYYYLAATGPALDLITRSSECSDIRQRVIADHRPEFAAGEADSPGDFVATGRGTCVVGQRPTRWAYFIAAPGYGPVREIGIPSSGLYLVVAVVPDSPHAPQQLGRMLERTRFGGVSVAELIAAARPVTFPVFGPV
ncbi:MAG: hypothetical protein ACRDHU_09075 [Actinomycetota bacterium]